MRDFSRRGVIGLVGGAAAAWPVAARAQQPAMPVIGFLGPVTADLWAGRLRAFHQGLSETGYVQDQNLTIEYRWANGNFNQLPALVTDLVRRQVAVIVVGGVPIVRAAKAATSTIPIVFSMGADPIESGLVARINRPGGNLTGVYTLEAQLGPKQLQLLREMLPAAGTFALLVNPANSVRSMRDLQAAANALGVQLVIASASVERDFATTFEALVQRRVSALTIDSDVFLNAQSKTLATLAAQHRLPTISQFREFAAAGGLMSYGTRIADMFRQVGVYTGRILKGDKPADLPIQQASGFELVINRKAAKALGIDVPDKLLALADEVIE
jgi:putative ABC transport system substrate-binding protein